MPDELRLGIMQPYFFPYLQHFALIEHVDRWVVFDVTQYTPKTWMNRNRVLHPTGGHAYVTVPVQGSSQNRLTRDIRLNDPEVAVRSITGKLQHYRRRAPYYREVLGLVERAFEERSDDLLVALDVAALRVACHYLSISFDDVICSELRFDLSGIETRRTVVTADRPAVGATEYLNPVGGAALFRAAEFEAAGIRLRFLDLPPMQYEVPAPYAFIPSLSILDVLMWRRPADAVAHIRDRSRDPGALGAAGVRGGGASAEYPKWDYQEYPKTLARDDFWGQSWRTIMGRRITEAEVAILVSHIRDTLRLRPEDVLLDLGCGNGALSARLFDSCAAYAGVDRSAYLIEIAKAYFEQPPEYVFFEGDVTGFAASVERPERYTKILCFAVVQYLPRRPSTRS